MRKIIAYGKKSGIKKSLANYITLTHGNGYEASVAYFKNIVNDQPLDAKAISDALNESGWTICTFIPYRPVENGIIIKAVDFCGNEDLVKITEVDNERGI